MNYGKGNPSAPPKRPRYANPNHPMNTEGKPIVGEIPTPIRRPNKLAKVYKGVTGNYSSD